MSYLELPKLPIPKADGACSHPPGTRLPPVTLKATDGSEVEVSRLPERTVLYRYTATLT